MSAEHVHLWTTVVSGQGYHGHGYYLYACWCGASADYNDRSGALTMRLWEPARKFLA